MNFKHFERLLTKASYDEVKVIGRDVKLDGQYAHIVGMTLKDRQAFVYVLELVEHSDTEEGNFQSLTERTHRQQMTNNCKSEKNITFLRVREFHSNGKVYAVADKKKTKIDNYNLKHYRSSSN